MTTWRRIASFCIWWNLILVLALTVSGVEGTGSLQITLEHKGASIRGESLTLYQVGSGMDYLLAPSFEEYAGSMKADALAAYVLEQGIAGTSRQTDDNGVVDYRQLGAGLYLVMQDHQRAGGVAMCPFLVSVPMEIQGEEIWDVLATPKTDITRPNLPEEPKLPQTGQRNWQVWAFLTAGMGFLICGYCLRRKQN